MNLAGAPADLFESEVSSMDAFRATIPLLALLFGAGTLTLARYRVAPLTWRMSSHFGRYGLLELAGLVAIGYFALLPSGFLARVIAVPNPMPSATGIVLLGLGGGLLVVGLLLLFRRGQ